MHAFLFISYISYLCLKISPSRHTLYNFNSQSTLVSTGCILYTQVVQFQYYVVAYSDLFHVIDPFRLTCIWVQSVHFSETVTFPVADIVVDLVMSYYNHKQLYTWGDLASVVCKCLASLGQPVLVLCLHLKTAR